MTRRLPAPLPAPSDMMSQTDLGSWQDKDRYIERHRYARLVARGDALGPVQEFAAFVLWRRGWQPWGEAWTMGMEE